MSEPDGQVVKSIPRSSLAPAFKLSLPHKFVQAHASNLLGNSLELATSASTSKFWHGSINPRRNRDRNEFCLRGWKLFAEAHDVQPGSKVAFELVSANRLVITLLPREQDADIRLPVSSPSTSSLDDPTISRHASTASLQRTTSSCLHDGSLALAEGDAADKALAHQLLGTELAHKTEPEPVPENDFGPPAPILAGGSPYPVPGTTLSAVPNAVHSLSRACASKRQMLEEGGEAATGIAATDAFAPATPRAGQQRHRLRVSSPRSCWSSASLDMSGSIVSTPGDWKPTSSPQAAQYAAGSPALEDEVQALRQTMHSLQDSAIWHQQQAARTQVRLAKLEAQHAGVLTGLKLTQQALATLEDLAGELALMCAPRVPGGRLGMCDTHAQLCSHLHAVRICVHACLEAQA